MEIIDLLRSHAGDIKARFSVKRIGLFGSYARGEQKASSDIYILVEFEKPTFRNFMDLSIYLEDLFGREVDPVMVKRLNSRIPSERCLDRILMQAFQLQATGYLFKN